MATTRIKFTSKLHTDFIKELRQNTKIYFEENKISRFGNFSLAFKALVMGSLYLLPLLMMLLGWIPSLGGSLLAWTIMGIGMSGVGMSLMHDANHGAFSKRAWVNSLLSKSMYFLGGFPTNWRYQHNTMHHGFTNIDGHDEDISPVGILRFSPHKPLYKIHKFQHIYAWFFYGLMTISWVIYKDFKQLYGYKKAGVVVNKNRSYTFLFLDLILAKVIYYSLFLVLPIVLIPLAWYWVVLGFFIMHFVCGFILGIVFQTAHVMTTTEFPLPDEEGNIDNNWAIHQLMTTTDYSPKSRFFSWFIGGLNYQVEHHLFPQISHVHYRKLSTMVKATAEKYDLPYYVEITFFAALKNHYHMLKMLGK